MPKQHKFSNKLLLNQWLISLFGIDPLQEYNLHGKIIRPFHRLVDPIKDPRVEGFDHDNLHKFYHNLINSDIFWNHSRALSKEQILIYEENIARHTMAINKKRHRPIVWKYYQWLTLLFAEIYLDRYFNNRQGLLADLNDFANRFNRHWIDYNDVPLYAEDDLNKLCLQSATGSGKTLLMHVNLLQFQHYGKITGMDKELSKVILLTPNERLSEQHLSELEQSGFWARKVSNPNQIKERTFSQIDIFEITKLADQEGPNTIATRSLGDQNLLLVDEGHRGMSGKEEGAWFKRRSALCAKGFTFEYSATFQQAVAAAKNRNFENSYTRAIFFDYSYRWFYEDGFGKDYQILNLPETFSATQAIYLTACLLKFYQQLRIYQENVTDFEPFNMEKPLWVFVGSTVSKAKGTKGEKAAVADVAKIILFIADFLDNQQKARQRIHKILTGNGQNTGLLDQNNNDIFAGSFTYLAKTMNSNDESIADIYKDILGRLFNNPAGGGLELARIKGDSGEIALKAGAAEKPFGLINVGDAKGLCDHLKDVSIAHGAKLTVGDSDFTEAMFASVKNSASPVNLLIGSKKFIEGWDCWRVSTMGLMHVGKSEGSQIIQLFGRGVRLKGYKWNLKRSGHSFALQRPLFIEELETLNVFGIEADFMEKFRNFLKEEGLPGNERRHIEYIPMNVTYDFGKKLKILRPKRKAADGKEYDFKKDAQVPTVGDIPDYLTQNRVVVDWYPRIQFIAPMGAGPAALKNSDLLRERHLALLNYDMLFFELERFKRERSWHNLNITREGICKLLNDFTWYILYIPQARLNPDGFDGVMLLQQVASSLLKSYCEHYYNYKKREYIEPRLELRELKQNDDNLPSNEDRYQIIADGDDEQVIQHIKQIKKEIEKEIKENRDYLRKLTDPGDLKACKWMIHLYQPLLHAKKGAAITILPVALNESEYQFVEDLKNWCDIKKDELTAKNTELFLLRNLSRGKGVGFFEAGNFHPDFILWMLFGGKQYVTFIEPHGLLHEGPASEKMLFYKRIKDIEKRLNEPKIILNSFILSWTQHPQLKWGTSRDEMEKQHVLFMTDDQDHYIEKFFGMLEKSA